MNTSQKKGFHFPQNFPMNFSGKLTSKIVIKDDYVRADGTCALYLQIFLNKDKKKLPVHVSVAPNDFDKIKQRVKTKCTYSKDYNIIIEKMLSDIHKIEISYRLSGEVLNMEKLLNDYENPTSRIDFLKFWEVELENQKLLKDPATVKQQTSSLAKVKKYKESILFYEITKDFYEKMIFHFQKVEKNAPHTIHTVGKNFKKYLHIANEKGIITPFKYNEISTPRCIANRSFLNANEIYLLNSFYHSEFINETWKNILARFLFSCFTGLRISDIKRISNDNIANDILIFFAKKTNKLHRIQLNESALSYIGSQQIFYGEFTDQYINRELKLIAKTCGIKKKVTFHVARHSFATNFLICGGRVEDLQTLLGHSQIRETMDYVHIVKSITDRQIHNMNDILTKKPLD
ncbi:MAG: site-specific integrase [Flavobacterium sp.]|nr:site-specific integrase [Flavobacterium sp.]